MPSWGEVLERYNQEQQNNNPSPLDTLLKEYIGGLARLRNRNVLCYYSGWLQHPNRSGTEINDLDMNGLMNAVTGMDRTKGLDLILHTPGGAVSATEAIINYLRSCFGTDICAFIPQMAMSGGTMIACACKEIYMGRQSSIGPTDPQIAGAPASGIVEEFQDAIRDVSENPASAPIWAQIIGKYPPAYIGESMKALQVSQNILSESLSLNMLADKPNLVPTVVNQLTSHTESGMHDRHFNSDKARKMGLKVINLETAQNGLQDCVLTIHHIFMIMFQQTTNYKCVATDLGHNWFLSGPDGN